MDSVNESLSGSLFIKGHSFYQNFDSSYNKKILLREGIPPAM